jgi:hypothetical protein
MISAEMFCLLALFLGAITLWWPNLWVRSLSYTGLVISVVLVWQISLGQPRPIFHSPWGFPSGQVIGYRLAEPDYLFLWILPKNAEIPEAIQLPWSENTAKQLMQAEKQAKAQGQVVLVDPKGFKATGGTSGSADSGRGGHPGNKGGMSANRGGSSTNKGSNGQAASPIFRPGAPNPLPAKTK